MRDNSLTIITGDDVTALLAEHEMEIINSVHRAYAAHARKESSLPHSTFLLFPDRPRDRIIALPAYLGGDIQSAGIKWISSFPENLERGLDRASAVLILNSTETGRPETIIEGSIISAKRTAASAALAAQHLQNEHLAQSVGMVGCGLINFEIARFLLAACPDIDRLTVFDLDAERANHFRERCRSLQREVEVNVAADMNELLGSSSLISLATTAGTPYLSDVSSCRPGSTILHISLRDLAPEVILSSDNVVDDVDHVSRAQTSIHLTEQMVGNRDFIRCTLAEILDGSVPGRRANDGLTVFSPFGLGVLDIAVGKLVCELAREQGRGTVINSFLPEPSSEKKPEERRAAGASNPGLR